MRRMRSNFTPLPTFPSIMGKWIELSHGCCVHFQFLRVVRQTRPCPALFVVRFGVRFLLGGERDLNLHRLRVLVHGLVDDLLDVLDERA